MKSRQGDILISTVLSIPEDAKKIQGNVIVYGEVTSHKHALIGGDIYKTANGLMFLKVKSKGQIVHDEHKPISLTKGVYSVIRQREYTYNDMTKLVVD